MPVNVVCDDFPVSVELCEKFAHCPVIGIPDLQ